VYRVELVAMRFQVFQSIGLVELERVKGLWVDVYPYYLEAAFEVPHPRAALATK